MDRIGNRACWSNDYHGERRLSLVVHKEPVVLPYFYQMFEVLTFHHQNVGTPELGRKLSTYWPTKWSNIWRYNRHTPANQTPISCVPVTASPGLKPKGTGLAWAAKPIIAATPGLGISASYLPTKHYHGSPLVMPIQLASGEHRFKYHQRPGKFGSFSIPLKSFPGLSEKKTVSQPVFRDRSRIE